jgi:carbamoyltransferase
MSASACIAVSCRTARQVGDPPNSDIESERGRQLRRPLDEQALFGIDKLKVRRSEIPTVIQVDYSARTGCPVLVNTSFNLRGGPIVNTPEDAFRCFMGSEIEILVGNWCCAIQRSN